MEGKKKQPTTKWFCVLGLRFFGFVLTRATYSLFASSSVKMGEFPIWFPIPLNALYSLHSLVHLSALLL